MNDGKPDNQSEAFPILQLGEPVYSVNKTSQVWLDHGVFEQEGALMLSWSVVSELFPECLIDEMFNSYHNWLRQLATSDASWSQTHLQLLPPAQLTQRIEVNQTTAPISDETLHSLFIKQVKQQGEAIALITPEYTLTYQELYTQAHKIGQKLQHLGATPNTLVAVLMTKGWEQVAAVLGILMSGAAYLPIDPTLPQERQWNLLEQGEVKLAITQAHLAGSLSLPENIQCLSVDSEEWETIEVTSLDSVPSVSDLAYVIFTSGSTGTPKGVMIDHRGAVNTILDINQRFEIKPNDRVLAVSALNFDLSVYDIFGILAAGATIVIPSPDGAKDPAHWVELMVKHQVTLWNTVPALMQMLVEYLSQHPDRSSFPLRLALLSGDWIPLNLPEQIKTFWSQIQVMSLGGATEASIWSVYYPITTVDPEWKSIPYGQPLANQCLYVLNERMEPCPNWVAGQLYIGGIGIAQGYWRNDEKTNASFIIHPHTGERLYKTGDLARYLPDGNTEFLGREDLQVKISGYRIELGEIEVFLQKHSAVKETVVTAVGELQNKQLVAYIVLHPEATATIDELRDYLQQCLPKYMVPPNYIFQEALPLTPNGKVDRKRLPTPELKFAPTTENYVPPRNSKELQLVKMWEDILGVQPVGVSSNFLDLGGHSLLVVRLMNRIEQELGHSLPLSTLFQYSTVEQLAKILEQEQVVSEPSPLVPIQPQGSQIPIFCVHPAGGTVFCYFELAQLLGTEQPFYGLQCLGQVEGEEPLTSVEDMAAVYLKAIREVQAKGPYILMGWSFGGMVALEMANNLLGEGEQVAFVGLIDTYAPSQMPDEEKLSENVEVVLELFGENLSLPWEEIRQLSQEEQVSLIWEQARQANLVPPDFETTQLERLLHIMKLNHKAMGSYSPPAYPGMITLFRAEAGSVAVSQEVVEVEPTLGWKEVATSGVEVYTIPGYHEYMVHQPNVVILAELLKSGIEKSLSTHRQNSSQ
jgi:amino acid adenylation domain-containing protein